MRSEDPPPSRSIPGYDIVRSLGGGGMGVVYLARQLSLDRVIAIKLLSIGPNVDSIDLARRFRREAELMAKIHHPNIVTVYEFGEVDGQPFIVMEYVEGNDLRHSMDHGMPLEIRQVRSLILPLASALDCLHKNGIIHRDLKPENILIGPDFTPKVTDFGIAVDYASVGSLTKMGQWLGTIGYVAPEQQYRLKVDERSDQYSMAAVIYEALTGQKPLGVFKPPSHLNKQLDARVDEVLMRALQEDRDDRFPTILSFGTALEAALGRRPTAVRKRARPVPLGLAIVSLLSIVVISWWVLRKAERDVANGDPSTSLVTRWSNSLGMKFVRIPDGEFLMGSPSSDPLTRPQETPAHSVRIHSPFYLSTHEVTVGQFRVFVEATGYRTDAESLGQGGHVYDAERDELLRDPRYLWSSPTAHGLAGDDEPVVQVSWNDAVEFCRWLSKTEGRDYRLPTEAEWEYACRANGRGRWCMGDDVKALGAVAWTEDNAGLSHHPVRLKSPNAFGLFDMHGNVWEWTLDRFAPYREGPAVDPAGPPTRIERVLRGGSWEKGELMQTRSGARRDSLPDYAYFAYGFRICAPI